MTQEPGAGPRAPWAVRLGRAWKGAPWWAKILIALAGALAAGYAVSYLNPPTALGPQPNADPVVNSNLTAIHGQADAYLYGAPPTPVGDCSQTDLQNVPINEGLLEVDVRSVNTQVVVTGIEVVLDAADSTAVTLCGANAVTPTPTPSTIGSPLAVSTSVEVSATPLAPPSGVPQTAPVHVVIGPGGERVFAVEVRTADRPVQPQFYVLNCYLDMVVNGQAVHKVLAADPSSGVLAWAG